MRRAGGIFLTAFILSIGMGITCGSFVAVGSGDQVRLYQNFDWCVIIMGVIIGLAVFGLYLHKKEKKSSTGQKNTLIVNKMTESYDSQGKKISLSENSTSNKKRLSPTNEVLKELLRKSGNRCNVHPCSNTIIDYQGILKGHVISIMSNEKEQPNYNPHLSNEDRITIDNLMLVCEMDYLDTKLYEKYTITTLMNKKREAEESPSRYQTFEIDDKIIEELKQDYIGRFL